MQKTQIAIVLLVLIALFGTADYVLNAPKEPVEVSVPAIAPKGDEDPEALQALLSGNPATLSYRVAQRNRVTQLFERADLSGLREAAVYKNSLEKEGSTPIILYEIRGQRGQGALHYLSVKSALTARLEGDESLNEDNAFGQNSFYFNDAGAPESAFLVVQTGDTILGFQFLKKNLQDFETVKAIIASASVN